jgi:hypothetical protein
MAGISVHHCAHGGVYIEAGYLDAFSMAHIVSSFASTLSGTEGSATCVHEILENQAVLILMNQEFVWAAHPTRTRTLSCEGIIRILFQLFPGRKTSIVYGVSRVSRQSPFVVIRISSPLSKVTNPGTQVPASFVTGRT